MGEKFFIFKIIPADVNRLEFIRQHKNLFFNWYKSHARVTYKKKSQKRTSQFNILLYNISSFIFLKKNLLGLSWCRIYRIDRNITKSFRFPELSRFRNRCFNRICIVQTNIWERWEKNQWNNFRFWLFIQKNRTYHSISRYHIILFSPINIQRY